MPWRLQPESDFSLPPVSLVHPHCGGYGCTQGAKEARARDEPRELVVRPKLVRNADSWAPPDPRESQCGIALLDFRDFSGDLMHAKFEQHRGRAC